LVVLTFRMCQKLGDEKEDKKKTSRIILFILFNYLISIFFLVVATEQLLEKKTNGKNDPIQQHIEVAKCK